MLSCSQLLDHVTFIDTPGVLSGEKQRTMRSYDFTGVVQWFAQRSDLILLLFDPHKLDISDEFKRVIGALRGQDDKIRVVLNKADQVDTQQVGAAESSRWRVSVPRLERRPTRPLAPPVSIPFDLFSEPGCRCSGYLA
jgi:predicted GTPase